jgi:hypothetical protein
MKAWQDCFPALTLLLSPLSPGRSHSFQSFSTHQQCDSWIPTPPWPLVPAPNLHSQLSANQLYPHRPLTPKPRTNYKSKTCVSSSPCFCGRYHQFPKLDQDRQTSLLLSPSGPILKLLHWYLSPPFCTSTTVPNAYHNSLGILPLLPHWLPCFQNFSNSLCALLTL